MSISIKQGSYSVLSVTTGGTVLIPNGIVQSNYDFTVDGITEYYLQGTVTLSSDLIYSMTTPVKGTQIKVINRSAITPSGNNLVIFGKTIPSRLLSKKVHFESVVQRVFLGNRSSC
jgi:hypothetical protein